VFLLNILSKIKFSFSEISFNVLTYPIGLEGCLELSHQPVAAAQA
jgi:hypothetical protein